MSSGPEQIITISYFISANLMSDGEIALEFVPSWSFVLSGRANRWMKLVYRVSDWWSGAAVNFGWMREAKKNTAVVFDR